MHAGQSSSTSKTNVITQSAKELKSDLSAATCYFQKNDCHNVIKMNESLDSFNAESFTTSHSVSSFETQDDKNNIIYVMIKRSEKISQSTDQQLRKFDKVMMIETAKTLAQNQSRCCYCFKYLMSDQA